MACDIPDFYLNGVFQHIRLKQMEGALEIDLAIDLLSVSHQRSFRPNLNRDGIIPKDRKPGNLHPEVPQDQSNSAVRTMYLVSKIKNKRLI